jgi:8-oxo-dGTP pyrophosphatase MutT (NUDIX family)
MDKFWHPKGVKLKYSDNVLRIEHHFYNFSKVNSTMPFTVVNTSDWVIIIPEIKGNKFVLVKQFRIGTKSTTLEFPGGAISAGEEPQTAAIRELEEETGLIPEKLNYLGIINPNPAFMSNRCFAYSATGCKYDGKMNLDMFEDIEVEECQQSYFDEMVKAGKITHSIVLAAYSMYLLNST